MGRSTKEEIGLSEQRRYRKFTAKQKLEIVLASLRGDRSIAETHGHDTLSGVHEPEALQIVRRLRPHGDEPLLPALADDVEWWAAGQPELLPWAGTVRGRDEVERWFERLNEVMDYDRFDALEFVAEDDQVVVVAEASGRARATGKPFETEIVRIFTLRDGKITRVRSYYDTYVYVAALDAG